MKKTFSITGMTCAACAASVERAVKKLGVKAEVSLINNRLVVYGEIADESVIAAVRRVGYGVSVASGGASPEQSEVSDDTKNLAVRFFVSLLFLIPLMYFSMGHMAGFGLGALDPHKNPLSFALLQLVLTTPTLVINGKFFASGFRAAVRRSPNMDTLVSIGSGSAYVYGIIMLFRMNAAVIGGNVSYAATLAMNLFFESAATILTLVTLGKFLEAKSKRKTRSEVDKLMRLRPQTATVMRDGAPITVDVGDIAVGDTVVVISGEYVPCDGVITEGATTLDKSAITGESLPQEASVGDIVTSATLNLTGRVLVRAQKVGKDATLGKIIELIENAGGSKAPIQKTADRVSAVFVPCVCAIALVTFIVWLAVGTVGQALSMAISVLVISCPCALGLATPVAVMAGTGRAAAYGVLVKNAEVLQNLADVKIFALDKTATITEGKPKVTQAIGYSRFSTDAMAMLSIAAALERTSTHPLARAIIQASADNAALTATDSEYKIGLGVVGKVDGVEYALGSARLAEMFCVNASDDGAQTVYLCERGNLLGKITVQDEIRPSSVAAVQRLKAMGARVVMLTGDTAPQADRIAKAVGITEVHCNVLPDGKLDVVQNLKAQGKTAMVGDGINDAPALKGGDIGIAIGSGTDVAIESADVVLSRSDLLGVPLAVSAARATMRNVKQNLFWAFIYNIIGIPLAAGVLYPVGITLNPMIAAAAMAFSSLFVVLNALRLTIMRLDRRPDKNLFQKSQGDNDMKKTVIKVSGMSCNHCAMRVKSALQKVEGVKSVDVDLKTGNVSLDGDLDIAAAKKAITDVGYQAE